MFNDLNQPGQPAAQTPPVDDIFAETDKSVEVKNFSGYYNQNPATASSMATPGEIETQKIGLSAADEKPGSSKGKIIKVILIALLIILFIGLGYLVYVKFLTGQEMVETPDTTNVVTDTTQNEIIIDREMATKTIPVSEEVTISTSTPIATTTPPVSNLTDTDSDGLTDEEENILGTDINLTDTDGDGLSDYEEIKIYNTDANKIDSDNDGLSDYEEIKIYKTDPNIVDSDGDSYNDGAEVKGGYNPLGSGKMADVTN